MVKSDAVETERCTSDLPTLIQQIDEELVSSDSVTDWWLEDDFGLNFPTKWVNWIHFKFDCFNYFCYYLFTEGLRLSILQTAWDEVCDWPNKSPDCDGWNLHDARISFQSLGDSYDFTNLQRSSNWVALTYKSTNFLRLRRVLAHVHHRRRKCNSRWNRIQRTPSWQRWWIRCSCSSCYPIGSIRLGVAT